jgi:hypothetical protein
MLFLKKSLLIILFFSIFGACKKDDSAVPENSALKDGKGFHSIAIVSSELLENTSGTNSGLSDFINVEDISILPDGRTLHFATSSNLATQQDAVRKLERFTFDLQDKTFLTPPNSNLGDLVFKNYNRFFVDPTYRNFGYREYSGEFYDATLGPGSNGINTAKLEGDFKYTRMGTFAQLPRVVNNGEVVETVYADNFMLIDQRFQNRILFEYKQRSGKVLTYNYDHIVGKQIDAIRSGVIEPKAINGDGVYFFAVSSKYLYVADLSAIQQPKLEFIDSLLLPADWQKMPFDVYVKRSEDGSKFGIVVNGGINDADIVSASFDAAAKKFTPNITKAFIKGMLFRNVPYDLDESGNFYFAYAGNNFTNVATSSIYKASGNVISTIGGDDILSRGKITSLKVFRGNVFAGISYRITPKEKVTGGHKAEIIRQD